MTDMSIYLNQSKEEKESKKGQWCEQKKKYTRTIHARVVLGKSIRSAVAETNSCNDRGVQIVEKILTKYR